MCTDKIIQNKHIITNNRKLFFLDYYKSFITTYFLFSLSTMVPFMYVYIAITVYLTNVTYMKTSVNIKITFLQMGKINLKKHNGRGNIARVLNFYFYCMSKI